uniref:Moesin/ezrin/radixin homolog 1 n=1 Tax=Loa loa TaxID=7209 RepID=A0A1I7VBH7_LOALO
MGKKTTEGEIGNIQQTMDQQPATVQFLDSTKHIFYVSKKADGGELFDKVCAFLGLAEKDYFGLSFADDDGNQQWIYDDKRISKQLKGRPWNFNFKVKFYPPEPATLAEDRTRHLLTLQIRHDISTGKLPATLATHALLGSYVAQSVRGDYEPSLQYIDFLRSCHLAPLPNETLYEKVEELHKQHKGETSAEADLHYLENAKKLSMYGVQLFHAKDGKGTPVQIGISAHGINVYLDQIRVHRFLWQNIIKIGYRRNIFIIKVKPGELEKNEATSAFKLPDYEAAKRVWQCGVEHHTFFRLIQPEEKPHKGLFRWGSARFRYQGRTQFQSKMASQMFCNSQPIQRSQSVRITQNDENVAVPVAVSRTLPVMYSENETGRKLKWDSSQMISPEKISSTHTIEAAQNRENNTMPNGAEVGNTNNTSGKLLDSVHSSAIFTTVATTTNDNTAAITTTIATTTTTTITTVTTTGTTVTGQYFEQSFSSDVSPYPIKITRGASPSTQEISYDDFHHQPSYVSDNLCERKPDISALRREKDTGFLPVEDKAVVYHPGHYEEELTESRSKRLREPPLELDDDFVLVHRPKLGSVGKIFHRNGAETNILVKEEDIEAYPIHRFADIYHSGFSRFIGGNKDFEVSEREKYLKTDGVVNKLKVDKEKYPATEKIRGPILHIERSRELPTEPLSAHAYVYNQGFYDTIDPNRTDIDEKGNIRNWLSCYKKPEKSQAKLLKEKNAKVKEKTEKNAKKLIIGDPTVDKSGSMSEQEDKTKKTAFIHVKQPGYERQTVQASYCNAESSEKGLQQMEYLKRSEPVTVGIETDKSDVKEKVYDSAEPKQTCRLFVSASDSYRVRPGAYGMPSTSYDEVLHNIRREEELPFSPIHENATVYHSGISTLKDKKSRKFLIQKERQKTTSSEASTDEEVQTDKRKKWTAVLDISEVDKSELTNADDVEKRPINEEVKRKHLMHEMEEKEYLDQMKVGVTPDSEMQKFVQKIKVKKGTKLADMPNVENESSHQKMKAVLHLREGQIKPSNLKKETILKDTQESKDVEHTIRPTYSILASGKSVEIPKKTELFEQSHSECILDNTPPPVKLSRVNEFSFQPLHLAVEVQNQIQNLPPNYRTFKRAKHRGTVEFVAKENIKPESYKRECTPYQGPLESTNYVKGLQFAPIHEYSAVYHPGSTYVKARKTNKRKNEEKSSTLKAKKIAALHLKVNDSDVKHYEEQQNDSDALLSKNDDQVTTCVAKIVCKTPVEGKRKVRKYPFKYRTVSGDIEIVGKSFVKPETYNLVTVPYDGPMSYLECEKELPFTPLRECATAYHSGISYKKGKRLRDSSTESSLSSSTSFSSSSTSIACYPEKLKGSEKMNVTSNKEHGESGITAESSKHKGIFSFWRKSMRSEKEDFSDDKKVKLVASSKPHLIRQQEPEVSIDFTASQAASSPSQMVSTMLVKDSVKEPESNFHIKNENKKMNANLYLKKESFTTSEYGEDNGKRGKFDPFHFWRPTDKESKLNSKKSNSGFTDMNISTEEPVNHTSNFDSCHEVADVRLTTKDKKKPIINATDKDLSTNVKTSKLALSIDMEEESLNRSSLPPSDQSKANIETKKDAFIYLKRDSELPDGLPLNLSSPGIPKQKMITTVAGVSSHTSKTNESGKLRNTEESKLMDKKNIFSLETVDDSTESGLKKYDKRDYVGYIAKVKVKREMGSAGEDLKQDSDLKTNEANVSGDISKRSNFVVKGFHLRGPPCDLESKVATHSSSKYEPEKDAHITEAVGTGGVTIREIHEANGADKPRKEVTGLKMKKKLTGGDVTLKENRKDSDKSTRGSFFSSLWRGSKPKDKDQEEHQKQQKLIERDAYGIKLTPVEMTSPSNELEYNIMRTKIMFGSVDSSSDATQIGERIRRDFVPVYDFSYVPSFPAFVENMEISTPATAGDATERIGLATTQNLAAEKPDDEVITDEIVTETGERRGGKWRQLFSHRSKEMKECNDLPALSEDQKESWRQEQSAVDVRKQTSLGETFVSELTWEKLGTQTEGRESQCTKPETFETEKLFHRSRISVGEIPDEPYIFTQTPPDIPVLTHSTDPKGPDGFVEQIKRQVTQAVTKTSPSSDIKKKSKKGKKQSKTSASPRESEGSNASEIEVGSYYDPLSSSLSKKNADKSEMIGELPSDEAKLDDRRMLLKERREEMYDLKDVDFVPATHPADVIGSLPHTNVESWQKTVNEPETVVNSVDHQGNIVKKTIKTRQVTGTVQQQTYQPSDLLSRNDDSEMGVTEAMKKSFTLSDDVNVTDSHAPIIETVDHKLTYEPTSGVDEVNGNDYSDIPGELVSSHTVTQGNRTIETITYKTEKNGAIETHVEHRVTIHSCDDIDHDAELSQAILEATNMNPDMTVEKIEVKHESQC